MMSINLSDIAILNIKGSDYCCIICLISKNEAITLLQNANLIEKKVERYKSGKEIWMFGNIEIEKKSFYCKKAPIFFRGVDIKNY